MYRNILEDLKHWLAADNRKPLVMRGARQVGKTWAARELAKQSNKKLIELNFEKQRELAIHFDSNEPSTILLNLESALNQSIDSAQCILFLDEIQAAPELLAKLRWFYESLPELPVIAAGSLLDFVLEDHQFSMPVGRINYCFIEPLDFEEFLIAKNETHLLSAIQNVTLKKPFNEALHKKANQLFKEYLMVGGMPEAVSTWTHAASIEGLSKVHNDLINTYQDDFSKYAGHLSLDCLHDALKAVPKQLTKKFVYSQVNPSTRHESIKQAVNLLSKACLSHVVQNTSANGIPIGVETNPKIFKMILLDVGLVSTLLGLRLYQFKTLDDILLINKGAITEQAVGQLLRRLSPYYVEPTLFYWTRESHASSAEIDYLLQNNQALIPIEVKAGSEGKLRSLHQFMHEKPWETAVRFYAGNLCRSKVNVKTPLGDSVHYTLLSLPLYLVSQVYRLLEE